MKFVISTQELNFLVNKCLNIVSQKATIPILSNFLMEAKNGELILTATDLTVGVRCHTEAKVLEEGATALPAKRFAQLIRELTSINVEISTNDNETTQISADSSRFKLHGMNKSEFPSLPQMEGAVQFKISESDLKEMLFCTAFAVSRDDNRFALTGVFMQITEGKAIFAGTDGKRLSRTYLSLGLDAAFNGNYILPIKAVEEILKNLSDSGEATVYLMHDKIGIETTNTLLVTKLLSGDYPDVSRVIPSQLETVLSLHREELITLLRQVSLFTVDTSHSVRFTFTEGELRLAANTMEIGEGKVSMPVNYTGPRLEIAFNPIYFLDILRHSKGETVTMGLTDPFNPGVITDKEGISQINSSVSPLFVLMPMRLNEDA
ncbi:DNA polymerase III subunit beta [Parachlamydia sp. AcF125]|uniref:DNA polymerase III subunit beta n=1 Tax=Parachlamydia sp. AcF125 TaxID=2795736 RepID=UPI001BC97352|nr:DNA polymerase III subunit beta [Parachlamydia sp. AcF125]MBS4168884.1 Beta sliding clamp [Parachlamydia sp. AcF125]